MSERDTEWNKIIAQREPSETEVYALVGRMLFQLHAFEKVMRVTFHLLHAAFAHPDDEPDADRFIWKMNKRACGQVAYELRKLMLIEPTFDCLLVRLVRRRNQLAHKLALRKEFDPDRSAVWHQNVGRFIFRLYADLEAASRVFGTYAENMMQADRDPRAAVLRSNIAALKVFRPRWEGVVT